MKKQLSSVLRQCSACAFISCLLANGVALYAQETGTVAIGGYSAGGTNYTFRTSRQVRAGAFFINGSDIGTILLKACDLDQDGKVTLAEFKTVAAASFKLWDTNADGYVSHSELSAALKELFPAPPQDGMRGVRVVKGGVATAVSTEELPTPDTMVAGHIFKGADANNDGLLSLQEINDFLEKNFGQWDSDGSGGLDAQELAAAFGQLALPDDMGAPPVQ